MLLTPSMQKVGPAVCRETWHHTSTHQQAVMLVNGKFPSPKAQLVGRSINPDHPLQVSSAPPSRETPEQLVKRGKSEMIPRLWKSLGVASSVCDKYKKQFKSWAHNKHTYVVGCTDTTQAIPSTHVFVTGCHSRGQFITEHFFATRSPCIDPKDSRVLEQLTRRPRGMSAQDWEWLLTLPFGVIFYPDAPAGMRPMPTLIANGDLDGDLYFLCWDQEVLTSLNSAGMVEAVVCEPDAEADLGAGVKGVAAPPGNADWLGETQELMMDCARISDVRKLYREFYKRSGEIVDEHADALFMHHPDARAFARAYSASLDYSKHCRPIRLPVHLHHLLPVALQKYLAC